MKRFGIIGSPLTQSPSGSFFNSFFEENSIDAEFKYFELKSLDGFMAFLMTEKPDGLLVTIPYKEKIFSLADKLDHPDLPAANMITIHYDADKPFIHAHNTDYSGFLSDLKDLNLNTERKALVIGSGGASKAVVYALHNINMKFDIISREYIGEIKKWPQLPEDKMEEYSLIVNTTPLGMAPLENEYPPLGYDSILPDTIAYDLVYKPEKTLFLQKCEKSGCIIRNGNGMLLSVYQEALKTWKLI